MCSSSHSPPFLCEPGLPFAEVLPAAEVERAFADEGVTFGATPHAVFTPALTLWAFLSQVLDKDKSCRAAVLRVFALLLALAREPCSLDTAAYCRARAKLPVAIICDALKIAYSTQGRGQYQDVLLMMRGLGKFWTWQIKMSGTFGFGGVRQCLRILKSYWARTGSDR